MKLKNKKIAGMLAVAAVALPAAVYAATDAVEVTAVFRTAITLSVTDMDFGTIEFTTAGVGDTATMGVDGNISYGGSFSGSTSGTAGLVEVTAAETGATLDIFCETSATLAEPGGETIDLITVQAADADALGAPAACNGLSPALAAVSIVEGAGATDAFAIGGILDGSTTSGAGFVAAAPATYSTTNTGQGGDPITVEVLYQ